MKDSEQLEQLLRQALSPTIEPSDHLNQKIINQIQEGTSMKPVPKKRLSVALIAAVLTFTMSITAFAAWNLLHPKQVAEHLGNQELARAFDDKNAIEINESVVSGGFNFTLLGIVSGESLSDFGGSAQNIHPNRTYAVVSIANQDGSKMPDTRDEEYGQVPFFISPLVKGQKPWLVNIASMNGGYSESVIDGVMYRLIECDGIEMFADRGLYLCISTSSFYDINAFNYNEETGEITPNNNYNGANALFNLPLDIKKADYEKAEKYLQELLKEPETTSTASEKATIDLEKAIANGIVIPESIKELTYNKNGLACYEYDGHKLEISVEDFFTKEETGIYKTISGSETDDKRRAVQLSIDSDGTVTGRIVEY